MFIFQKKNGCLLGKGISTTYFISNRIGDRYLLVVNKPRTMSHPLNMEGNTLPTFMPTMFIL